MDPEVSKLCDSCYARHTTNSAVIWCPHCGEGFCTSCGECHNTSKVGKFHKTISIDNLQRLPSIISDIKTNCTEHQEIYVLYCQKHQQCLCLSCLKESHHECKAVIGLRDVIGDVKSSAAFEDIEMSLRDIDEILSKLKENRLENKRRLGEQKTEYLAKIQQIRLSINNHLDKLENEMANKITVDVENIQLSIDHILGEIEERNANVKKLREDIASIKELSTELQIFLGMKTFHDLISKETEFLAKLQSEEKVNDTELECDISDTFSSFCDVIEHLRDISILQKPCSLSLNVGRKERAQNMLLKEKSLAGITVGSKRKMSYPLRDHDGHKIVIKGCTILHDGSILFTDCSNSTLVLSDGNDIFRDIISLSGLYDVAYKGNNEVVVTVPDENEIVYIDLLLGIKKKSLTLEVTCRGIDYMDEILVVKVDGKFFIIDREGNVTSKIKASCLTSVAVFENKIFGTNYKKILSYVMIQAARNCGNLRMKKCKPLGI